MSYNFKNKRSAISLETKIKILDRLERGEGSTAVGKEFGLGESTIRVIKKNEDAIRNAVVAGTNLGARKSSYSRGIHKVKMEKALVLWLEDLAQKKIPVDGNLIKRRALGIYESMKDVEPSNSAHQPKHSTFSASTGWLTGFLKRYGFRNMKIKDEGASADEAAPVNGTAPADEAPCAHEDTSADENCPDKCKPIEDSGLCPDPVSTEITAKAERAPITANLILEGLHLASQLESYFLENDSDFERASRFQRELRCCISDYRELYKGLVKPAPQSSIAKNPVEENKAAASEREITSDVTPEKTRASPARFDGLTISSNTDSDLRPVYKWMRKLSDSENSRLSEDENI